MFVWKYIFLTYTYYSQFPIPWKAVCLLSKYFHLWNSIISLFFKDEHFLHITSEVWRMKDQNGRLWLPFVNLPCKQNLSPGMREEKESPLPHPGLQWDWGHYFTCPAVYCPMADCSGLQTPLNVSPHGSWHNNWYRPCSLVGSNPRSKLCNPHFNSMMYLPLLFPCYRWENPKAESESNHTARNGSIRNQILVISGSRACAANLRHDCLSKTNFKGVIPHFANHRSYWYVS